IKYCSFDTVILTPSSSPTYQSPGPLEKSSKYSGIMDEEIGVETGVEVGGIEVFVGLPIATVFL
ncbi:MAG: hypothetical protein WBG94_13210, partial [Anaerolineales bacterium]